jgi:TonB family protein
MRCVVRGNGTLTTCEIVSEKPLGYAFGRAALRAAQYFKMRTNGAPIEGALVMIPMAWRVGDRTPRELTVETLGVAHPPEALREIDPDFPDAARAAGQQGEVWIRVSLGEDGVPGDPTVKQTSRSPTLDAAAVAALRDWRFAPARDAQDRPVPATVAVHFKFHFFVRTCAQLTAAVSWTRKAWPEQSLGQTPIYRQAELDYATLDPHKFSTEERARAKDQLRQAFDRTLSRCESEPAAEWDSLLASELKVLASTR